jgi:MinD-like ATPase involved in chromosome partitioning or flagellar assembly
MKVVSIHSFRGGTGKSNTTANLAAMAALAGHRVGVIDTDIHSPGIHVLFNLREEDVAFALNDFLFGRCRIEQAARDVTDRLAESPPPRHERTRLFLVPSSVQTGEIARVLREGYDVGLLNDGFQALETALGLDYLFIDTHPGVNEETLLSIAVSDLLLLILRPDNQDFQGTAVALELARRLDVRDVQILVNKVPPGTDWELLRQQVERGYEAAVVGMLPLNHEMAQLASSGLFALKHPNHPFTRGLRAVLDRILA